MKKRTDTTYEDLKIKISNLVEISKEEQGRDRKKSFT
jgi:hypothetical protein